MSLDSLGISWTDGTLNSLYGCWTCSIGCRLCYAVNRVHRHSSNPKLNHDGRFDGLVHNGRFTGEVLFDPRHLYGVLKDRNPKMIFVNEFSDLLHEVIPMETVLEHFRVFKAAQWHQFQVLTKRSHRLAELNTAVLQEFGSWPTNVWQGVSVCSVSQAETQRIEHLGATGAFLKWISFEPWVSDPSFPVSEAVPGLREILRENQIQWTVIGGESGPRDDTNIMAIDDARHLVNESRAAGSRVHFKQLGTALAIQLGTHSTRGGAEHRAKGGNPDQWPEDLNIREWPEVEWNNLAEPVEFRPSYDAGRRIHLRASPTETQKVDVDKIL